ncbi:hypothetical protein FB45DRAFT_941982 [Roridomyces roridus]|uniref:Uncharacterized protein n=1 Tax=Roridomyces roridus TaxID=1738132 RepID=A0AAD7F9N9_9AGAR|nr:hypothetical protein FB45DRAFT_941982 [Roridomyces roridus]
MDNLKQEQDVDMDAPAISILDTTSPPPPPRRVKLVVKDTRPPTQASSSRKRPRSDDEEDEEDQLIDDVDVVPPVASAAASATDATAKRKATKRKPRKSEKKVAAEEEKKAKEKIIPAGAPTNLAPTQSWFEVSAAKAHQHVGQMGTLDVGYVPPPLNIVPLDPGPSSKPPPKKKAATKPPAVPRPRAKPGPKPKNVAVAAAVAASAAAAAALYPMPPPEETDVISEAGYSVTAASSPVTAHFEGHTPEPPETFPPFSNGPLPEEALINLQDVALPQYPLPTKPFSVQPPPKITTGFAPGLPLDRSGTKVRRWRPVNREIRGIAGGRWSVRSWVGEKESAFATALAAGELKSSSVALPKLPSTSTSAPATTKSKARVTKAASRTVSAAPSRASSTVPSKMRNIMLAPPSDGADSDMMAPPGT